MSKMRWNEPGTWVYSDQIVHPAIVDDSTFGQARDFLGAKSAREVVRRPRSSPRPFALRGVLFCGICHRRMLTGWAARRRSKPS